MSIISNRLQNASKGFTIVELLIVIVVVGILAAITIVSFSGIQQRARDAQRKQNLSDLSKALSIYITENKNHINTGADTGDGQGWVNGGSTSILPQLQAAGLLEGSNIRDPECVNAETSGCFGYIKMTCGTGVNTRTYFMTQLKSEPAKSLPAEMNDCGSRDWWAAFNRNYYVTVR